MNSLQGANPRGQVNKNSSYQQPTNRVKTTVKSGQKCNIHKSNNHQRKVETKKNKNNLSFKNTNII